MFHSLIMAATDNHSTYGDAAFMFAILAGVALIIWAINR